MLALVMVASASPATAQTPAQMQSCTEWGRQSEDELIRNCTGFIDSGRVKGKELALLFQQRGIGYRFKGDFNRAVRDYDQALANDPSLVETISRRCFARAVLGQLTSALEDCEKAASLNQYALVFSNRGFVYLKMGDNGKAIADYDRAVTLEPQNEWARYGRGLAKLRSGDVSGGGADIVAATRLRADIADEFARYGLKP